MIPSEIVTAFTVVLFLKVSFISVTLYVSPRYETVDGTVTFSAVPLYPLRIAVYSVKLKSYVKSPTVSTAAIAIPAGRMPMHIANARNRLIILCVFFI